MAAATTNTNGPTASDAICAPLAISSSPAITASRLHAPKSARSKAAKPHGIPTATTADGRHEHGISWHAAAAKHDAAKSGPAAVHAAATATT